jgi:Holliday junction resolvasome RuvABC endonuclease subunit
MNILSIDPGSNKIGIYALIGGKAQSFTIRPGSLSDLFIKLYNDTMWDAVEYAFIEDFAFSRNGKGQRSMAEYVGVIKVVMEMKNVEYIKVPISTWKVYTGKDLPKKKNKEYLDYVNEKYNKNFDTTDAADAFLIMFAMFKIGKGDIRTDSANKLSKEIERIGIFK